MKELRKHVNIWRRYGREFDVLFFWLAVWYASAKHCIFSTGSVYFCFHVLNANVVLAASTALQAKPMPADYGKAQKTSLIWFVVNLLYNKCTRNRISLSLSLNDMMPLARVTTYYSGPVQKRLGQSARQFFVQPSSCNHVTFRAIKSWIRSWTTLQHYPAWTSYVGWLFTRLCNRIIDVESALASDGSTSHFAIRNDRDTISTKYDDISTICICAWIVNYDFISATILTGLCALKVSRWCAI